MKAYEWIDRLKVKKGLPSDYAAAKLLGMTTAAITQLRSRGSTLSDDVALKLAHELGLHPVLVLTDQATERAKTETVQREWNSILRELMDKEKTPHMAGLVLGGNGRIRNNEDTKPKKAIKDKPIDPIAILARSLFPAPSHMV